IGHGTGWNGVDVRPPLLVVAVVADIGKLKVEPAGQLLVNGQAVTGHQRLLVVPREGRAEGRAVQHGMSKHRSVGMAVHVTPRGTKRVVVAASPTHSAERGLRGRGVVVALDGVISAVLPPSTADDCLARAEDVDGSANAWRIIKRPAIGT